MITPFDFHSATRIVFGPGRLSELGALAQALGCRRALVVSDPGIVRTGHTQRGIESLGAAGLATALFDHVRENPTTDDVAQGCAFARDFQPDLLVGLGGGSSMDCAKGINFIHTGGGEMRDYWGQGKARGPMLPLIAVPTTAGTGSETQSFALISDSQTKVKMACGDRRAAARVALLDPELTLTQPPRVTALTGLDALAHAVETYVTRVRTPLSIALSREAWWLLSRSFLRVLAEPQNLDARAGMQWGAALAGLAIENSMLGAAHALSNPLTAACGIVHGQAVALMLPHVVRFNAAQVAREYAELSALLSDACPKGAEPVEHLAAQYTAWIAQAGLATCLETLRVDRARLPELAESAARQWTAGFNPRPVTQSELLVLYENAYGLAQ